MLQILLITCTILASWLGMQVVHEMGHVSAAFLSGGQVQRVVLHPMKYSRTDLTQNPHPGFVAWMGPLWGVIAPIAIWGVAAALRGRVTFVARFFAGFCLIANGSYLAIGSFDQIGDSGEMLRCGSQTWHLLLFGMITIPMGFLLWHRQGSHFGFSGKCGEVDRFVTFITLLIALVLVGLGLIVGGE